MSSTPSKITEHVRIQDKHQKQKQKTEVGSKFTEDADAGVTDRLKWLFNL